MVKVNQDPAVAKAEVMRDVSMPRSARNVPSRDVLLNRYRTKKIEYQPRNSTLVHLLRMYENDPVAHGMRGEQDQPELIINRFFDTVNTFVDFKGIPPNIHFYPPNLTPEGKAYADDLEKYTYANWDYNDMDLLLPRCAFDQSLGGWTAMGVLPTKELDGFIKYRRFSPTQFYPQCFAGTDDVVYYFYEDKWKKEQALERWPHLKEKIGKLGRSEAWQAIWPDGSLKNDEVVVLEYCDDQVLIFMVCDEIVETIPHNFGFCLSVIMENIVKPDTTGGSSDVATYETAQVYESELASIVADIVAYWADPMLWISSDTLTMDQVNIGGVTIGGKGDTAQFLQPSVNLNLVESQMTRVSDYFHDGTVPKTMYGKIEAKGALGSGIVLSGLQTKFMVRLHALYRRNGRKLVKLNTMALEVAERLYKNKKIEAAGMNWRKKRYFELEMYGSRIQKYKRHRIFWDMSVTDPDRHMVMEIQKCSQKLQSKYTTMENLGLSPADEFELMRQEDIYEIKKQAALRMEAARLEARAQPTPEETNREIVSGVKGGAIYEAGTRPKPGRPAGTGTSQASAGLDAGRVAADLTAVKKLRGEVYLVDVGDTVDVAITDKVDKATILNAPSMAAYKGRVKFILIQPGEARQDWLMIRGGQ